MLDRPRTVYKRKDLRLTRQRPASHLVFGKEVTLQTFGLDKYGRTLADVVLSDGTHVNHTLVKDGWCWWFGNMRQAIRSLKGWRRTHEMR